LKKLADQEEEAAARVPASAKVLASVAPGSLEPEEVE
jgi:hypothetical protein